MKRLEPHRAHIRAIMEVIGDKIEQTRKTGEAAEFKLRVDPKGGARIFAMGDPAQPLAAVRGASDHREDADLGRALEGARKRGRLRSAEILSGEEMLSADAFANLLGVSRVTVNTRRQKNELLALDGAKRGFRFPAWQVDENGKPYPALRELFEILGGGPWTVYRFLVQRHPELAGARALDALRRGRTAEVLEVAESVARGALG
jgi:hypothetical protein